MRARKTDALTARQAQVLEQIQIAGPVVAVKTTMIYTHVMQDGACGIKSPLTRVRQIQRERGMVAPQPAPVQTPTLTVAIEPLHTPETQSSNMQTGSQSIPDDSAPRQKTGVLIPLSRDAVRPWKTTLRRVGVAAMWLAACILGRRST